MFDEQDRQYFYNEFKNNGYEVGSYDDFKKDLNNKEDRDWYYNEAKNMGYDVGTQADFDKMVLEPAPSASATNQSASTETKQQVAQPSAHPSSSNEGGDWVPEAVKDFGNDFVDKLKEMPGKMISTVSGLFGGDNHPQETNQSTVNHNQPQSTVQQASPESKEEAPVTTPTGVVNNEGMMDAKLANYLENWKLRPDKQGTYFENMVADLLADGSANSNEEAVKMVLSALGRYANRSAMDVTNKVVSSLPDDTVQDAEQSIETQWYSHGVQDKLKQEADSMGISYDDYVGLFLKPAMVQSLVNKYGPNYRDIAEGIATRLYSHDENVQDRLMNQDINEALSSVINKYVNPSVVEEYNKAQEAGSKAFTEGMEGSQYIPANLRLGTALGAQYEANEAKDPAKVLSGLQKKFGNLYRNPEFLNDMSNAAFKVMQRYGLNGGMSGDPKQFKPMINSVLKNELDQLEIKGMMPKGSAEYIMKTGLGNTIVGKITRKAMQTDYQNWLEDIANQQYQPGFWENVASGALTFAGDAWSYWLPGAAGGKLTKSMIAKAEGKLAGDLMAKGMERKMAERAAKVLIGKSKAAALKNGAVHGAATFGGQSAISKPIDEIYRTGQFDENGKIYNPSVGKVIANTLGEVAKQSAVGAIMQGGTIANMVGKGRGLATNILADVGGKVVDSGIMTGQQLLERMAHDPNFKPTGKDAAETFLESGANLMSIGFPGFVGKYARFKDAREFNKKFDFTDQDIAELKRFGYDDLRDAFEKVGIGEYTVVGENAQRLDGQLTQKYMNLMNDKSVPEVLKAKMMAVVEGKRPSSFSPVVDSIILQPMDNGGKVYLETLNKDGGVVDRKEYSSLDEAQKADKKLEYEKTLGLASVLEGEFHKEFTQEHLEGLYNKAAQKYNMGEKLTDEDKAAVYLHQNAGAIKEIMDKQQKGVILTDEEQKQVNAYRHYYDSALENSSVMREFVNTFEDSHGVARGTLRKALESKDKKYAPLVESYLKELYNSIELKREMKQIEDDKKRIEQGDVDGAKPATPVEGPVSVDGSAGGQEPPVSEGPAPYQDRTTSVPSPNNAEFAANPANVANSSAEGASPETKVAGSDAFVMGQNAYKNGDSETLQAIDYNSDLAAGRLKRAFADNEKMPDIVANAYNEGRDMEQFVAQRAGSLTPAQKDAINKYVEAMDAKKGAIDALQHADDGYGDALKEQLWPYQTEDGNIVPATLDSGKQVFLKKANEYGGAFVVVPDEQGQPTIKQVSAAEIVEVGTPVPLDEYIENAVAQQKDARAKQFISQFDGSGLKPNDHVTVAMEQGDDNIGMTFAGYSEDGKIVLTDGKDYLPLSKEEFAAWRKNALDNTINEHLNVEDEEREQAQIKKAEADKQERYKKGIFGYAAGQPDYSDTQTDPKVAAEYLQETAGEDRKGLFSNIVAEKQALQKRINQLREHIANNAEWLSINADLDPKNAETRTLANKQMKGQIADLQARFDNWNKIRSAVMTPEEAEAIKADRTKKIADAGVNEGEVTPIEGREVAVLSDEELKKQYPTMDEASSYITSERKRIYRLQSDEAQREINGVDEVLERYVNGEIDLEPEQLKELNTTKAQLQARQANLTESAKDLKAQADKLKTLYRKENMEARAKAMENMTPAEQRAVKVENAIKNGNLSQLNSIYEEVRGATDFTDTEPNTIEEYVANNIGRFSLNYEGKYKAGVLSNGIKQETGLGRKDFDKLQILAKEGEGKTVPEFVHSLYDNMPEQLKQMGYSDQDIRDAFLNLIGSAENYSDLKNYTLNNKVAEAEQSMREIERQEEEMMENSAHSEAFRAIENAENIENAPFADRLQNAIAETETEPTEAQKKAGNYKKGHLTFGGYNFTVETPKGTTRSGKDEQGKPWSVTMHDTYGYILGKIGVDGDHIDMFINDTADLDTFDGNVYVVDQVNPETGEFDEHKVMYGYPSEEAATEAYLANYSKDWKGLGKVTSVPKSTFDKWLESSDRKTKPFADYAMIQQEEAKKAKQTNEALPFDAPMSMDDLPFHRDVKEVKPENMTEAQKVAYDAVSAMLKKAGIPVKVVSNEDMEKVAEAQDNLAVEMLLNDPRLRFYIKTPEQKEAAKAAYDWAAKNRPDKFKQYAIVNMDNPNQPPQYFEKKDLAEKWRKYYTNAWKIGNYKAFNLNKPFEDQIKDVKGEVPNEFDPYKAESLLNKRIELEKQIKETEDSYNAKKKERAEYQNQLMQDYMDQHGLSSENDIPDDVWTDYRDKSFEKYQDTLDDLFHKYVELDNQLKAVAEPGVRFLRTYHGTGASFDKFDLSHALEGEGSESFGHGVYVTNSSKIGREYAQRAKQRKMEDLYKNMRYPDGVKGDIFKRRVFGEMVNDVATGGSVASAKEFAKKRVGADANDIQRTLENLKDREKGTEYEQNLKDRLAEYKEGLKWIDSLDEDYLTQGNANRYDVDIPDDNGSNYLDWEGTIPDSLDKQKVAEDAYKVVSDNQGFNDFKATPLNDFIAHTLKTYVNTTDVAGRVEKLKSDIKDVIENYVADDDVLALNEYLKDATPDDVLATIWYNDLVRDIKDADLGEELYRKLSTYVGDNAASQILSDNGLVGIKYPAGMIHGGAKEGDYNYVIFDENNANIVGNTKFAQGKGVVYGYTDGKQIVLNQEHLNPNTPIHEYQHLWRTAAKNMNPELIEHGDKLIMQTQLFADLKQDPNYNHLTDEQICDEAFARLTGEDGAAILEQMAKDAIKENPLDTAKELSVINKLKEWLKKFWYWTLDTFTKWKPEDIKKMTLEDIRNLVLRDLANGVDPRNVKSRMTKEDAVSLRKQMADNAEQERILEHTEENWQKEFGKDSRVTTPIGSIKLGENQYKKAGRNDRIKRFGLLKPTLERPDVILEKSAPKEGAERQTKYLFIKSFKKADGNKILNYESITVKQGEEEVAISAHQIDPSKVVKELTESKVLWNRFRGDSNSLGENQGSALTPSANNPSGKDSVLNPHSDAKIRNNIETAKENDGNLSVEDKIKAVSQQFGVDEADVTMYANAIKKGSTAEAARARANIKRHLMQVNEGNIFSFKDVVKYTKPINEALKENFGDLDAMIEERVQQVQAQRNAMEAARKRAEEEEAKRQKHLEELSLIPDDQLDKQYMDALAKGDDATAREMLDEAARRKGYDDTESAYQGVGAWAAPGNPGYESDKARRDDWESSGSDVNLEDIALGYTPQPDDYFSHPERYSQNTPHGLESVKAINTAIDAIKNGEKDVKVKVYRAVPTSVKEGKLRNADWVTPSKKYADMHGANRLEGKYRIIEDEVPATQLWWDGNDANEFGFDDGKEYKYKNAKNNRKLNDLVTYDDEGDVIPPSKRFNSRKQDVRFHRVTEPEELDRLNKGIVKSPILEQKLKKHPDSLMKAGTYFSGGGLVEEGLKGIIDPVVAVEYDRKISGVYRNNFGQHIVTADVRDVDPKELVKHIDGEVEYFHASPVCKNYSQAKSNSGEVGLDKETAKSTADFIDAVKPRVVTIENVKGYKDSEAMKIITQALDKNGYTWDSDVYNAADYGGYTSRERLIVRAVKDGELPEKPKKQPRKGGWLEAVEDILPTLTEKKSGVAPWMDARLKADGIDWKKVEKPLYVMGSAYADGKIPHAYGDEILPTLRTKSGDVIIMPGGKVLRADGRVLARITGLGDDYKLPKTESLAHTIIGNGIPVQLTQGVIAPLLNKDDLSGRNVLARLGSSIFKNNWDADKQKQVSDQIVNTANKLGGAEATVYTSVDDVPDAYLSDVKNGATGWYDPTTHTVHVYLPNCADANEAERTVLHEKVGHEGMEVLLGGEDGVRKFANFVYNSVAASTRGKILDIANKYDPDWKNPDRMNIGTQEYIARLAEEGPKTSEDFTLWTKIKHYLIRLLKKLGIRVPGLLNDKDLRYYLMKAGKALHVWDEMPQEKQETMMKQASNAEIKDALSDGAGKGKPRQKKGESTIQYMKRVQEWRKWQNAREDKENPEPPMFYDIDKDEAGKKEWAKLNKDWRERHHLVGEEPTGMPIRMEGEEDDAYMNRIHEYEKWQAAMKDQEDPLPDMFAFEKKKQEEVKRKYEDWLAKHDLLEQQQADLDLYEGKVYPAETDPKADALEQQVMQDLAEVTSTDVSKEGAAKTVKHAVIHRRKNMEEASADDAIYINDVKNRIEKMADSGVYDKLLSDYKGKKNRAEKLAETIPYIIEAPRRLRDMAQNLNATGVFDKGHIHIQPADVEAIQPYVTDLIVETAKKHTEIRKGKEIEVYDDPQAVSEVASKMAQAINANHQGEEGFVPCDGTDILSKHVLELVKQRVVPGRINYKELSPEMQAAIDSIRDWYNYTYDWLMDNRTLKAGTGYNVDYVNHIWDKEKSDPNAYATFVENRQRTKSPNEKKRTISTLMEGIYAGLVPKTTDITKMMAYYSRSNIEAWANKTMLQELTGLNVIERNEKGEVISTDPLLSSSAPFNLEQYKYFEIPGVGPVWVYNVSPKQVKVKNPITDNEKVIYSEASAGDRFGVVFDTYQSSPFWKTFDTLASSAKKLELGFSGFHAGALTEVYMVQNMVEFGPKKAMANFMKYIFADTAKNHELPCFANPEDFQEAASHLVKFGATNDYAAADVQNMFDNMRDAMIKVQEKLKDGNKISGTVAKASIPFKVASQMLSLINKGMDVALWDFLHDGLKLATYRMRADKTKERAKKKGWTEEELSRALDEDGQFVNDMFGGQHWDVLGASHRTLRYAGRVLLSPDWNASTTRHFLALTGYGSIWNEATFENFKQYYKRLKHKELTPEDEGRRSRQISALLCYGIGFMVFYEGIANGINAAFRALDEEKERKKAEEIRKTNPSYKSMYELAYGDEGMKWYDYLMRGNSLGQQSKIFLGRYEDGTEMYVRHGKQFREVPEYLFNHKGELEFPGPMVQRMIGKANPMVRMTLDDINYLSDFQASHADQEIQRKYGKAIGLLYKDALYWAPFLIPSQENKEFKTVDFFFPSSKGFSPWKAQSYFKDFILSGDMEGVVMTYQSCQRNGIDPEAQIKAAIGSVKALESAEISDGVTSLQEASKRFDAAKSITEKKKMRQKMKKFLSQSDYKAFTQKEALDMVQGYLNGDDDLKEMEKAESKYLMKAKAEDVTEDWRIQNVWNGTMETYQEYQRLKDIDNKKANAFKNSKTNKRLFAARKAISAARRKMNKAKKQMDGANDAAKLVEIRNARKELLKKLNGME